MRVRFPPLVQSDIHGLNDLKVFEDFEFFTNCPAFFRKILLKIFSSLALESPEKIYPNSCIDSVYITKELRGKIDKIGL